KRRRRSPSKRRGRSAISVAPRSSASISSASSRGARSPPRSPGRALESSGGFHVPKQILSFTVNDDPVEVLVQPYMTLLDALREETRRPTEEQIRYGIAGNLCRCTGYTKMVAAISEAAHQGVSR